MIKILLACGVGASSGFIAQSMRKAAKKMNIECSIKAVSDIEIGNYLSETDVLIIGPHIRHKINEINNLIHDYDIIISVVDQKKYAMLDGEGVLNDVLNLLEERKEK